MQNITIIFFFWSFSCIVYISIVSYCIFMCHKTDFILINCSGNFLFLKLKYQDCLMKFYTQIL